MTHISQEPAKRPGCARETYAIHPARSPSSDGIFDVVAGCVDEDPALVPRSALHPDVLVDVAKGIQLPVAYHDGCRGRTIERGSLEERAPS